MPFIHHSSFTILIVFLYQCIITILLLIPLAIACWNLVTFARVRRGERPRATPMVSVLAPARNEERSIAPCVESLLGQDYPEIEVIVLDDLSEDRTGEILARMSACDPRLRVLQGGPLPPGWIGKNWACWHLAAEARGEWLCFTDADTVHHPLSIASTIAAAERLDVPFISAVPKQIMSGFWERVVIPMTQYLYFAWLPNRWITTLRDPRFSAANGQLLCIRRDAYDAIDGHRGVANDIVEDVVLARRAKARGIRVALATAVDTIACRMYRSPGEIVEGFSKNLYPGFGYNPVAIGLFVAGNLLLHILPLLFLAIGLTTGDRSASWFALPLAQLAAASSIRGMIALRFRMGGDQLLYHPLSALAASLIALRSWRLYRKGAGGGRWKGRVYPRT